MKDFPLIGVCGSVEKNEHKQFILRDYLISVVRSGGLPVLVSMDLEDEMVEALADRLDGLYLAGGSDVAPFEYGAEPIPKLGQVNPLRDRSERLLIKAARERDMPILGICRGIQMLNVALGGTLYQDLSTEYEDESGISAIGHDQTMLGMYPSHEIDVEPTSMLCKIYGKDRLAVNSFHHQSIRKPADSLIVTARSSDGVIEAVEDPNHSFLIGVQWHPERMPADKVLFDSFVQSADEYKQKRDQ